MKWLKALIHRYRLIRECLRNPGKQNSWTYRKYRPDFNFDGKKVLNLGCGSTVFLAPNVVNLDMFPGKGVNVVHDLSKMPLPFKDGEFDLIVANHILEHVPDWWNCFKDLARVLKIGGRLEIWGPGDGGSSQLGYRDHINVINHCSFMGVRGTCRNLTNAWEAEEQKNLGFVKDLEIVGPTQVVLPNWWWVQILPNFFLTFMVDHLRNIVTEIGIFLVKRKPLGDLTEYLGLLKNKNREKRSDR